MTATTRVNTAEFKNRLSEFLALVKQGTCVVVCQRNVPVAELRALDSCAPHVNRTSFGSVVGTVKIRGDLHEPCFREEDWEMLNPDRDPGV